MPLSYSADRTFPALGFPKCLELGWFTRPSPQLLNVVNLVQTTSALVLALEQSRKLVHRFTLPATLARRQAIQNSLVLDAV